MSSAWWPIGAASLLAAGTFILFISNRAPRTDAALRGYPLDDAWIHMVYARALVEEGGFHYNAGVPEAGMTSPLWVVLLAGVHAVAGDVDAIVLGAKILALGFGIAGIWALYRLARTLGEARTIAFLAAALFALDPSLTFSRAAGMEVPLFTFLVLAALAATMTGRPIAAGAAFGLSVVSRPEGIILLPLFIAIAVTTKSKEEFGVANRRLQLAVASLLAVLPSVAYMLFCLHATGNPLPNTFYAKFQGRSPLSPGLLSFGWRHYVHDNLPYFTLEAGGVLAILGAIRHGRRNGRWGLAPIAAFGLLFAGALASRQFAPGHFYYWERWLIPAFPFLLLVIAGGIGEILEGLPSLRRQGVKGDADSSRSGKSKARRPAAGPARVVNADARIAHHARRQSREARMAWGVAAGMALALTVWSLPRALRERAQAYAWNNQNIEEMNVVLGRWVAASTPPEAVVAVNDAGALRYYGQRRTVDILGLNEHRMLRQRMDGVVQMIDQLGVDYFVLFPDFFRGLQQKIPIRPIHQIASPHYTICEGPQDLMIVGKLEPR